MTPESFVLVGLVILLVFGITFAGFILWYLQVNLALLESELHISFKELADTPKKEKKRIDIRC